MSKFKVGDRVLANGKSGVVRDVNYGLHCPFLVEHDVDFDGHNGSALSKVLLTGNKSWWYEEDDLASPTLTIQAGRFYKTRDGRKVGPMRRHDDAWSADGGVRMYIDDGQRYFEYDRGGPTDIIAEWVEPVAVAQATATFKVGDAVDVVGNIDGRVSYVGKSGVIKSIRSGRQRVEVTIDDLSYYFDEHELAHSQPATIKVGDWVLTDDGDIGIVLHDDGTDVLQFKVGYVGDDNDEQWDWFSDLQLTIVPPGTTRASNDNAVALKEIDELELRLAELRAKLAA